VHGAEGDEFGTFEFGLTEEQETRAAHVHGEALVIDLLFQGPCGYRTYQNDDRLARLAADQTRGLDPSVGYYNVARKLTPVFEGPIRLALARPDEHYRGAWEASGITGANLQLGMELPDVAGMALAQAQIDHFPWLIKGLRAADFRRAKKEGQRVGYITAQDTFGLGPRLENLQVLYDFGLRMLGLTYNLQNSVGGGCTERTDAGVSNLGAELIARMNEFGIIVDTAHSGRQTTLDACALSGHPVVASHTSAAALYDTDRAKSDEELHAIKETGGVVGIYAIPFFLTDEAGATIEVMLDHIDYVANLLGWEYVGIGTDWPLQLDKRSLEINELSLMDMGFSEKHNLGTANLIGFDDYRDFPNITRGLVARGYSDAQIEGILGDNFLRVFERVCG
jgi:membrane dipeptidase